jgi:4-alpha-glucanotransferase
VKAFSAAQLERVEYFEYLQWEADRQLGRAAEMGREGGLSIGLYRDLAVGVDPCGAEAWSDQELHVLGATIGAPPDLLNLKGQNWGLTPVNPIVLRRRGFAPFIANLRANMRHAGALRIDHVMALQRLYWVPSGREATEGAYVSYPMNDLLRVLALESQRNRCLVVGEDLGTVPTGFRDRMREANILSCRVLLFEREADGAFASPDQYPALAAASVGTHDLATLTGYWMGRDIEWRRSLDLYPTPEHRSRDEAERVVDRQRLLEALTREGVLSADAGRATMREMTAPAFSFELGAAVQRFLARSKAHLVLAQIEDLLGELEQINLPGTLDQHPNWCRKLSVALDELLQGQALTQLAASLNEARTWRSGREGGG